MRRTVPRVDGLAEWELGLLFEIRLLHDADALGPVLDAIASGLEMLAWEPRRRELEEEERSRAAARPGPAATGRNARALEQARERVRASESEAERARIRQTIWSATCAGALARRCGISPEDVLRTMYAEIADKARIAAANRCRAYVFGTA